MSDPTRLQYHPRGYPELGLVARTLPLRYSKNANVLRLRQKLEKWEAERGNTLFQARNLETLKPALAFELVHVYVAMRERYPKVRPDFIDFNGKVGNNTLAEALTYRDNFPTVRQLVNNYETYDVVDGQMILELAADENFNEETMRDLRWEARHLDKNAVQDPGATGYIVFGDIFKNSRKYRRILKSWQVRNEKAVGRGNLPRVVWSRVSVASLTLMHEFGHLVENELLAQGRHAVEAVYGALSEVLLEVDEPSSFQYRHHLVNYPTYYYTKEKGRNAGGERRGKATRQALHTAIRSKMGTYATTVRDELFAECFAHAYGGARMRRELAPFVRALKETGVASRRLPNKTA